MTAAGNGDIFISKLDASGNFLWAKSMGGADQDLGYSIAIDTSGYIYTTGYYQGTADFNPGAGTYNLTSVGGNVDIFISKLDALGNFVWAKSIGGSSGDVGYSIAIDAFGNVYTTGYFQGTADCDPGGGTYNLTSAGSEDIFISKLDALGNFVWAKSMGGTSSGYAKSIAIDTFGNIYTTGIFQGTVDFNPGIGSYNLISAGGYDIFISKLDTSGNFVWAKSIGGTSPDQGKALAIDASGNIYTTGYYYNGPVDFDPSVGVNNYTSSGVQDIFISKLDASGNFVWAKSMGGADVDIGYAIAVDALGNVYTTGIFEGTGDFNPGIGTYNLTSTGLYDIFISKLDASGNFVWAKSMGGSDSDNGNSIAADASGNVYTTGLFQGTADFDPGAGTYNFTTAGLLDIFISKLCSPPSLVGSITGPSSVCVGGTATYSFVSVAGVTGYLWTVPAGAIINSGQNTTSINVTFSSTSGNIEVTLSNSCGNSASNALGVLVNSQLNPTVGFLASPSSTVCPGTAITLNGTGALTYTWSNGINDGVAFVPISVPNSTINYTVTGTDINGCANTHNVTITVSQLPIVDAIASPSSTICAETAVSLSGTGAATYTWNNGITNAVPFVPSATGTYTVTGIAGNGCENTDTILITINPLPIIDATVFPFSTICAGSSIFLSGTGASTYTWSDGITDGVPFVPSSTTSYTVTGTDTNGCTSDPEPISIIVYPLPIISSAISDANYGDNGAISISVTSGLAPYIYDWSLDGTGDLDDSANQTGLSEGIYTLTVSDQNGCRDTIDATITNGDEILIPTGISPNGDGFNDKWVILGIDQFKDIQVNIFNLQGQCIYNQQQQYTPWSGLYNGALVPVSDYFYVIESVNKKKKLTGTITVKY